MREYLNRFSLDALKLNATTNTCAIVLWLVVVACAWFSVNRQPFNKGQRLFWLLFISLVPFVGMLCYLPVCAFYATQDSALLGRKK